MGPNGSENFKTLLDLQFGAKTFRYVLSFPPNSPHIVTLGIVEILCAQLERLFFENFNFTIIPYGKTKDYNFLEKK